MKYAAPQCSKIVFALVISMVPVAVKAAAWRIIPSVETTLAFTDNISFQSKGNEEAEMVLGVKPAVRVQSTSGQSQLSLNYGIDNLYYVNDPNKNSSQHSTGRSPKFWTVHFCVCPQ